MARLAAVSAPAVDRAPSCLVRNRVPALPVGHVARPRVVALVGRAVARPLTVVRAPAGYGKTTAVAEWARSAGDTTIGWLRPAGRPGFAFFWNDVVTQLTDPPSTPPPGHVPASYTPDGFGAFLTGLFSEWACDGRPRVLVLDDYQQIDDPAIDASLLQLVDGEPPRLGVVVVTRCAPRLRLPLLRARAEVSEIGVDQLRFDEVETAAFLAQSGPAWLAPADNSRAVHARTEGWPALVRLATVAAADRRGSTLADHLSGADRYLADFLADEVLGALPADARRFLQVTAVAAEHVSAPLADALVGRPGASAEMLRRLEDAGVPVFALDDERHWYCYHPAVAETLRAQLRTQHPPLARVLPERAAAWFAQRGLFDDALRVLVANGQYEQATQVVERHFADVFVAFGPLRDVLELFPGKVTTTSPWLLMLRAWSLMPLNQLDEAARFVELAEHAPRTDATSQASWTGVVAAARAMIATLRHESDAIPGLARSALDNLPGDQVPLRRLMTFCLGVSSLLTDDVSASRAMLESVEFATSSAPTHGDDEAVCLDHFYLAQLASKQGRLRESRRLLCSAPSFGAGSEQPIAGLLEIGLANLEYEADELEPALCHARRGVELSEQWWISDAVLEGYVTMARCLQATGDTAGAQWAYQQATRLAVGKNRCPFVTHISVANFQLWLESGLAPEVFTLADTIYDNAVAGDLTDDQLHKAQICAIAQLTRNRPRRALTMLEVVADRADAAGLTRQVVECHVLMAVAATRAHLPERATEHLAQALTMAEPEGYVRVFVDEGTAMTNLLQRTRDAGTCVAYVDELLSHTPAGRDGRDHQLPEVVEPLTDRELEVLALTASGMSTPEIAAKLFITTETVRKHRKSTYRKLGVHSSLQAVHRGKVLGLV